MMKMNDVVRGSRERFDTDQKCLKTPLFLSICRHLCPEHFSRHRKMYLERLVLSILNRKGLTLSMELRRFFRFLKPKDPDIISNAGYLKQRMKLNPEAFMYLSDFHVTNFYSDLKGHLASLKGYYLFAVDGSTVNLPNTPENQEFYGTQINQSGQRAQAGISCLHDVLNKMILAFSVNHRGFSERVEAEKHIEKIPNFIGNDPFIVVFDRGYPSSFMFINRLEQNQKFVVRLSSSDFRKEQCEMRSDDEDVEIVFTQARTNYYRKTQLADVLRQKGSIKLRFLKIRLPGDQVEVLATNLSRDEFSRQEIGDIYRMRWGIETAYDILKNTFQLENFTGKKPIIIEQDIFSTVYLFNLTFDMIRDAEILHQESSKNKQYKHPVKININKAIGVIKEDLIRMALEEDSERRGDIYRDIIESIAKNLSPVRDRRKYPRTKSPSTKYPVTKKRSY